MQTLELAVLDWIQLHCRCEFLDALTPFVSALSNHGEIWIVLALGLLLCPRTRRAGFALALALAADVLCCNAVLKPLIARVRPCDVNTAVALLVPHPADWAFPSGHAAAAFAATGSLTASGSRWRYPAFFLAVLTCFARLYLYVHWPSDVLAGAVLGTVIGFAGVRAADALCARLGK